MEMDVSQLFLLASVWESAYHLQKKRPNVVKTEILTRFFGFPEQVNGNRGKYRKGMTDITEKSSNSDCFVPFIRAPIKRTGFNPKSSPRPDAIYIFT